MTRTRQYVFESVYGLRQTLLNKTENTPTLSMNPLECFHRSSVFDVLLLVDCVFVLLYVAYR